MLPLRPYIANPTARNGFRVTGLAAFGRAMRNVADDIGRSVEASKQSNDARTLPRPSDSFRPQLRRASAHRSRSIESVGNEGLGASHTLSNDPIVYVVRAGRPLLTTIDEEQGARPSPLINFTRGAQRLSLTHIMCCVLRNP